MTRYHKHTDGEKPEKETKPEPIMENDKVVMIHEEPEKDPYIDDDPDFEYHWAA